MLPSPTCARSHHLRPVSPLSVHHPRAARPKSRPTPLSRSPPQESPRCPLSSCRRDELHPCSPLLRGEDPRRSPRGLRAPVPGISAWTWPRAAAPPRPDSAGLTLSLPPPKRLRARLGAPLSDRLAPWLSRPLPGSGASVSGVPAPGVRASGRGAGCRLLAAARPRCGCPRGSGQI